MASPLKDPPLSNTSFIAHKGDELVGFLVGFFHRPFIMKDTFILPGFILT